MAAHSRPYLFYGATRALCAECLGLVDAKYELTADAVHLWKRCPAHGVQRVLLADDVDFWRRGRELYLKEPEQVARYNTGFRYGCPYDCGICPDHEQHGCLTLLELTDHCNLTCPTCYASSSPERTSHRSLSELEQMLDCIVANEVNPDVVQLSGGEPTLHPNFFEVLAACKRRPIRHLMLNTNGLRIANEPKFAERLAEFGPGFEVYLQFDSLQEGPLRNLRGADLRATRLRALEKLNRMNLSTTLVVTVKQGQNDGELGDILRFALQQPAVRGVTFQPVQDAGRNLNFDPALHRLTLTQVRRKLLEQFPDLSPADVLPVPCHPDCIAMAYGIRDSTAPSGLRPLTRYVDADVLLKNSGNTIAYEADATLRSSLLQTLSTGHGPESAASSLRELLCCLPAISGAEGLSYDRVFRVIILQFLDRHSLDLYSVRKSCVHIAHPDGKRIIPFDTYNLFYRDALETERLLPLRRRHDPLALFDRA